MPCPCLNVIYDRNLTTVLSDTGLITLLVTSSVPGLQLFDKHTRSWQQLEHRLGAFHVVVMIGEKVPQFSGSDEYTGCLHRVVSFIKPLKRVKWAVTFS